MDLLPTYVRFLRHPIEAAAALRGNPRAARLGLEAMLVPLVGYFVVYVGLSRSGAYPSTFAPWLALPAETYYRYNVYLVVPSMLAAWLLASSVVQLLGRLLGARGVFEETVGALGIAISVSSLTLLPHDLTVALLGAAGVIDGRAHEHAMNQPTLARDVLWFFMALYAVAFPVYFTASVSGVHGVRGPRAVLLGVVGFAVYQLVFLIANR